MKTILILIVLVVVANCVVKKCTYR